MKVEFIVCRRMLTFSFQVLHQRVSSLQDPVHRFQRPRFPPPLADWILRFRLPGTSATMQCLPPICAHTATGSHHHTHTHSSTLGTCRKPYQILSIQSAHIYMHLQTYKANCCIIDFQSSFQVQLSIL